MYYRNNDNSIKEMYSHLSDTNSAPSTATPKSRTWMWVLLVLLVLLIGGFVFWKLRKSHISQTSETFKNTVNEKFNRFY